MFRPKDGDSLAERRWVALNQANPVKNFSPFVQKSSTLTSKVIRKGTGEPDGWTEGHKGRGFDGLQPSPSPAQKPGRGLLWLLMVMHVSTSFNQN